MGGGLQIYGFGAGCVGIIPRNLVAKCMVENCRFGKSWGRSLQIYGFGGRADMGFGWCHGWDWGLGAWGLDLGRDWCEGVAVRIGALRVGRSNFHESENRV